MLVILPFAGLRWPGGELVRVDGHLDDRGIVAREWNADHVRRVVTRRRVVSSRSGSGFQARRPPGGGATTGADRAGVNLFFQPFNRRYERGPMI